MRLYFIRHAQSDDNVQLAKNARDGMSDPDGNSDYGNLTGDPELSETGRKQLAHISAFLSGNNERRRVINPESGSALESFGITHVYASYMVRSMETASAIANELNITPMIWEDLHETGGIWSPDKKSGDLIGQPGNNRAFFEKRFPEFQLPDHPGEEGWWNRPLETSAEIKARARRFCKELFEQHGETEDRIVAVGHGLFYSFILNVLLKIPPKSNIRFTLNNTGITRIDLVNGMTRVIYMNRLEHLPSSLITS